MTCRPIARRTVGIVLAALAVGIWRPPPPPGRSSLLGRYVQPPAVGWQ